MKQLLQSLKDGRTTIVDVPRPTAGRGTLLIETRRTLVSAGTERMIVSFGQGGWLNKVRQQPDKVRMVLDKVRTDGIVPTVQAVRSKLDEPVPLGYCNVGRVVEVGTDVTSFSPGMRVASNGAHAELVSVRQNLCAQIPDNVTDDEAAFTVVGAIALQGIRLIQPTLGEVVTVTGMGLIGLIAAQLLRAHGCTVIGLDFDRHKLNLADELGFQTVDLGAGADPVAAVLALTNGRGADAVLITASTDSHEPVAQAAHMCRKRGRIVLVGVTGLNLSRADFYEKELSFQVSCSYGPGRYDPAYEEAGHDYPLGFVRWTEQRNFEAVLAMMASGRLNVRPLISHRYMLETIADAYALITSDRPSLGILLDYPESPATGNQDTSRQRSIVLRRSVPSPGKVAVAFVGAGNYAANVLAPAFQAAGAELAAIASNGGLSGTRVANKYGFAVNTTDTAALFDDPSIDLIVIGTRHDSHAALAKLALSSGKHVFVEKPLALSLDELEEIAEVRAGTDRMLMVGFNRRFAPMVNRLKRLVAPMPMAKSVVITVNAGAIPAEHWTQDKSVGGGRIVGEACHFVDLARFLVGHPVKTSSGVLMRSATADTAIITLAFEDGSVASVQYLANGSKMFPKERIEVFAGGRVAQLDNYRRLRLFGWPNARDDRAFVQDKGQKAIVAAFLDAVRAGGVEPIPFDELMEVSATTIRVAASL